MKHIIMPAAIVLILASCGGNNSGTHATSSDSTSVITSSGTPDTEINTINKGTTGTTGTGTVSDSGNASSGSAENTTAPGKKDSSYRK